MLPSLFADVVATSQEIATKVLFAGKIWFIITTTIEGEKVPSYTNFAVTPLIIE
jgi:hypothetical protein